LFELDLQTSLRQIDTTNDVARTLEEQGGHMIHVTSLDRGLLEKAVDRIVRATKSRGEKVDPLNRSFVRDGASSEWPYDTQF
jgi:hypothetical protein